MMRASWCLALLTLAIGAGCSSAPASADGGAMDAGSTDGGCVGFLSASVDGQMAQRFGSICASSWGSAQSSTAVGYLFSGGAAPGTQGLTLDGCTSAASGSEGLWLNLTNAMGTGTFDAGLATYTDPSGGTWGMSGDPFSVTVSRFDSVGGVIEGSFSVMVTHGGNAAHGLTGTFHVCRVPDELVP